MDAEDLLYRGKLLFAEGRLNEAKEYFLKIFQTNDKKRIKISKKLLSEIYRRTFLKNPSQRTNVLIEMYNLNITPQDIKDKNFAKYYKEFFNEYKKIKKIKLPESFITEIKKPSIEISKKPLEVISAVFIEKKPKKKYETKIY